MNKLLAILLVFVAAQGAAAQQTPDTVQLDELVVTAARLPRERSTLAASISVLHGDELRRRGIRTVSEALRSVSGTALVQTGSYGAFTSLFMRGGESDYVQVLIDGVQVNSPGEHFDFANLTLEDVERIEIVRGPGSVLYGSDAVTGVVQLFTRHGARRTRLDFAAAGGLGSRVGADANGSFGSGAFNGSLRGREGALDYALGASHFRSTGAYAFNNEYVNTGYTGRLSFVPDSATSISTTLRYNTNTFHYPTDGAGNLVDANQYHVADAVAVGIELGRRITGRFEARAQLGFNRNTDAYSDAPDGPADTLGFFAYYSDERFQRESADLRFNYAPGRTTVLTLGGEFEQQRERGSLVSESEFGPFAGRSGETRANRAAYAQLVAGIPHVDLQAGVRSEDNDRFGNHTTYRAGISTRIARALRARVAAGTAFKEPRFYEQFATGFVKGNPALDPETSRSIEGGLDLTKGGALFSLTWFGQRFRNLIQYVGSPPSPDAPNYLNLAAARASGLELQAARSLGPVGIRANYTWLDTRVTDAGTGEDPLFAGGSKLIRRPEHSATVELAYTHRRMAFTGSANHVGKRDDLDFNDSRRVVLGAYTRVDLAAELPVGAASLRATVKVENVFAAGYEEARNFPARGRVAFVGMRYGN